jgi:hypothetical protein
MCSVGLEIVPIAYRRRADNFVATRTEAVLNWACSEQRTKRLK